MKVVFIVISVLLAGCSVGVDKSIYWNSVGEERSLICINKEIAVNMVRFSNTERSRLGQILKIKNMHKSKECIVVNSNDIIKTNVTYKFPLTKEFPEKYRGVRKVIKEITYKNDKYWLVETKK